jgi:hypothetical protein
VKEIRPGRVGERREHPPVNPPVDLERRVQNGSGELDLRLAFRQEAISQIRDDRDAGGEPLEASGLSLAQ